MNKILLFSVILLLSLLFSSMVIAGDQVPKKWMIGTEMDLVPYIFDGYYISAVAGYGKWRARFVRTNITTPGFITQSDFEDNELNVHAYIIDYYFKKGFRGWWIGPGYETWDGEVKEKNSGEKKSYRTGILTLGGGYTLRFNDHFYINPWAAVHIPVNGDKDIEFTNETFKIRATPEVSIKIGMHF